jgi:hypothetical protein
MSFSQTSRDIFNLIAYKLPMEDVWNECQSSKILKNKCDDDFWKRQLRYRFPRITIRDNPKKQFGEIIGFLKTFGGKTWLIKFSENLVISSVYKDINPCDYQEIKIDKMFQVDDEIYYETNNYESNIYKYIGSLVPEDDWESAVIAKAKSPIVPGQKVWIATGWNEDFLAFGMIFDSLEGAKKYLIENIEKTLEEDIVYAKSDAENFPGDIFIQENWKEISEAVELKPYIKEINEKGCFHYWNARAFRIFEHTLD